MRTRIKNKRIKRQLYEWHVAMLRLYGEGDKDVNDVEHCYNLISNIMHTLGCSPTRSVGLASYGSFIKALIINYYDNRNILRIVLKQLGLNQAIELLNDYTLPVHLSKSDLMDFVHKPKYLVNGENYEWGGV